MFPMQVMVYLRHMLAPRALSELCLTGELIGAGEAKAIGLVNHVTPTADLDARLDKLLASLRAARQVSTPNLDVEGAADHLLAVLLGIRVLARSKPNLALLESIETALAPLGHRSIPPVPSRVEKTLRPMCHMRGASRP